MGLKLVHISDVHIRNLKFHDEYRRVFDNLNKQIEIIKPDAVINTGDTGHTKTQIGPEFVQLLLDHSRDVSSRAPYEILLGNHDMNLMNLDRQDSISPVIDSIKNTHPVRLHKKSGLAFSYTKDGQIYNFWVFSLADIKNFPTPSDWAKYPNDVNIGLFHGSIRGCITDLNWRMNHTEQELDIFEGLDYVLMGDIHKQQFFMDRKIAYAGSLIQQNFGEEIDKGFLLWDIPKKGEKHTVQSILLEGSRKFFTVELSHDLSFPDKFVDPDSRVRIIPPRQLTLSEQRDVERNAKKKYSPHDVIVLSAISLPENSFDIEKKVHENVDNIRDLSVQEKMLREFFEKNNVSEDIVKRVVEMNTRFQMHVNQNDECVRGVKWTLNKIAWSNFFNYGQDNALDFTKMRGLIGLFAPNGSGKSNFIDVILETLFNSVTKGVNKNIFLINDNKEKASAIAELTVQEQDVEVERSVERVKYEEDKEWGKTSVELFAVDNKGLKEVLTGETRAETDKMIRQKIGTYDDLLLTSIYAQWNPLDMVSQKESRRKEIFFRFFDLDMFGAKALLAKDEMKEHVDELKKLEALEAGDLNVLEEEVKSLESRASRAEKEIDALTERVLFLESQEKELLKKKTIVEDIKLGDCLERITRAEQGIQNNQPKIAEIEQKKGEIKRKIDAVENLAWTEQDIEDLRTLVSLKLEKSLLDEKTEELKAELTFRENDVQTPCEGGSPNCKLLLRATELKEKVSQIKTNLTNNERLNFSLESRIMSLEPVLGKHERIKLIDSEKNKLLSELEKISLQEENLQMRIKNLQEQKIKAEKERELFEKNEAEIKSNQEIDRKIFLLQEEITECREEIDAQSKPLKDFQRQLVKKQIVRDDARKHAQDLKKVQATVSVYEHYLDAMGKDGIPYEIMSQLIPVVNEEINKILSVTADFNVVLEHDPKDQSLQFLIQYGRYKSRPLEMGGGAEKFIASIAIRCALLRLTSIPRTDMLIIDEGFGKLDPKSMESIQRMFEYLRTVYEKIIVISHVEAMKDLVDGVIELSSDEEGYAHMSFGGK